VHRLANALVRSCGSVDVTVFSLSPKPHDSLYRHVHLFPKHDWLRTKVASYLVLPLLLNTVRFNDFDVVHFHGDDWFTLLRSTPSVRTFHGSALREARSASSLQRRVSQHIIFFFEQISARIRTVSAAVGPQTAQLYPSTVLVQNGVDLDSFMPGKKSTHPSILFVGTWSGRKRGRYLFEIFTREVLQRVPSARLYMVCDQCPPSHDSVTHLSCPDDDTLASLYRKSWVLAHPSLYEGFGIPYIEAMASGTAVLSSPNPGSEYVLSNGKYGVLADDRSFPTELERLLMDRSYRQKYIERGLTRAPHFSWQNVAHAHLSLYKKTISKSYQ